MTTERIIALAELFGSICGFMFWPGLIIYLCYRQYKKNKDKKGDSNK